jgi:MFS family permease
MSNAMAGLDGTIVNTALPAIIADLHGIQYMGWIVAVFLLTEAVSTPLWSKFGERRGNKLAYMLSTFTFGFGGLIQGLAPNITCFILARGLMGIGAGGMNTIPFIIYARIFNNIKRREEVIGIATASFSTASILGPVLGGWLVDTFSWRWIFFINIPIAVISILLIQSFYREHVNKQANAKVDYLGAGMLVSGLALILTGVQLFGQAKIIIVTALMIIG